MYSILIHVLQLLQVILDNSLTVLMFTGVGAGVGAASKQAGSETLGTTSSLFLMLQPDNRILYYLCCHNFILYYLCCYNLVPLFLILLRPRPLFLF